MREAEVVMVVIVVMVVMVVTVVMVVQGDVGADSVADVDHLLGAGSQLRGFQSRSWAMRSRWSRGCASAPGVRCNRLIDVPDRVAEMSKSDAVSFMTGVAT